MDALESNQFSLKVQSADCSGPPSHPSFRSLSVASHISLLGERLAEELNQLIAEELPAR